MANRNAQSTKKRNPAWVIVAVIAAIAVVAGVGWVVWKNSHGKNTEAIVESENVSTTGDGQKIEFEKEGGRIEPVAPVYIGDETLGPLAPKYININGETAAIRAVYPVTDDPTGESGWTFHPPSDVSEIAWLGGQRGSSYPGDGRGTVMMTGHIDMEGQGTGYANLFLGLKTGDKVEVTNNADVTRVYEVEENPVMLRKDQASTEEAMSVYERASRADGEEELVLITCSGDVVNNGGVFEYDHNTFVFLKPVDVRYDGEGEAPEHLMYLTR